LADFGQNGTGNTNSDLNYPYDVAVNPAGTAIYVLDNGANRIKQLDSSGAFVASSGTYSPSANSADGKFAFPTGLDYDTSTGTLIVADTNNHRIQRFSSSLVFVGKWGALGGSAPGDVQRPSGVATDGNGNVWVSDQDNDRLQRFGNSPQVQITSPAAGTSNATSIVHFTVTDPAASCDTVDGATAGPFSPGAHVISVSCTNAQGVGSASVTINVLAPVTPPGNGDVLNPMLHLPQLALPKKLKLAKKLTVSLTCENGCTTSAKLKIGNRSYALKGTTLPELKAEQKVTFKLTNAVLKKGRAALKAKTKVTLTVSAELPAKYNARTGKSGSVKMSR
jgi:hypothetical protein